ncbi:MAG: dihydroorotate dehydrogenase catalytic subunit [Solirubrobacterales bacterium]|jgi:dihydroorotate dehydrogenase (NAD+) catalytic subunit|nr:dihydroorotate dehydrogenase catalytic subunit [Solirubrobacterales bacterium]
MSAPFGRRLCEVAENRVSGGYRIFSLIDREGQAPEPGQFYMLASERGWGEGGGRPFLPRAISVAETAPAKEGVRLDFLVEGVGPGTDRLCELEPGESVWVTGPLGNAFSTPKQVNPDAAGAILVGGGIGIAPMAIWRRRLVEQGIPLRVLLGFRNQAHSGGLTELFCSGDSLCPDVRLATEDGHAGHQGYVTDLLVAMLAGDDATSAVVYTCGPPAMLDAVRSLCEEHGISYQLAEESPMACGFGACFGCAVPRPGGGYLRLCVDGPVTGTLPGGGADLGDHPERGGGTKSATGPAGPTTTEFCGIELTHPVINASGTYDAIAARKVFGDELLEDFPFAAFVSKTITPEPRAGNEPQRIWETPAGMVNSIGLPNKGLEGFLAEDLPQLAELPVPLIVSVMATNRELFSRLVTEVADRDEVAAIELNVSCPNVHSGLIVGEDPDETQALLQALRPLTAKPLIVKLTPNVASPEAVAVAAEEGGADAVSLINTLKASAIDPATRRPALAAGHGGLSGPAVRPIALQQLRAVRAAVELPLIGMGGISSGADATEFLDAGASLVAVGTESFRDPRAGSRIAKDLQTGVSGPPSRVGALDL